MAKKKAAGGVIPPTKSQLAAARNEGHTSHGLGKTQAECHLEDGDMREAWKQGWMAAESLDGSLGRAAENDAVSDAELALSTLMLGFDNAGVAIAEAQWRQIAEDDQMICRRWLKGRQAGAMSPVPTVLQLFANARLQAEIAPYFEEQAKLREVVMNVQFLGYKPTKPEGDDSEPKIKMTMKVPDSDVACGTASQLWGSKRVNISFGTLDVHEWDQLELPGVSEVFSCVTEIKAYSWARGFWKFGFYIEMSQLSEDQAYQLWKLRGTCVIEALGEIVGDGAVERDVAAVLAKPGTHPAIKPAVNQEPLWKDEPESRSSEMNKDGLFVFPDQYVVPLKNPRASCILRVGVSAGRFYIASDFIFASKDEGDTLSFGDEFAEKIGDGFVSLNAAIAAEAGSLIDLIGDEVEAEAVNELRDYMKAIEGGLVPTRYIPKKEESLV